MGLNFGKIGEKLHNSFKRFKKEKPVPEENAENVKAPRLSEEAYDLLVRLFEEFDSRPAATSASRNAARRIGEYLETATEDVTVTSGRIIPDIQKWMLLAAMVSSALVFLFATIGLPLIATAIGCLYIASVINELRMRKNPLRSFFPSGDATNVHAIIDPEGDVEHTIIFSAHHDTATVGKTERKGLLSKFSLQTGAVSFVILVLLAVIDVFIEFFKGRFFATGFPGIFIFCIMLLSFAVSGLSFYLSYNAEKAETKGAGDNLSGVSVVITLCRYFSFLKKQGKGLQSTRLVFASFDGEECGAAGSSLWYRDNSYILINPVNLNFDGLYGENDLAFLSSDGNGFVSLSPSLASHCSLLSIAMGYKVQTGRLSFLDGATDAVSAARHGIEATTLTSMASGKEIPAHSAEDTPEKVSQEALSIALSTAIKLVEETDRKETVSESSTGLFESGKKYRLSRY